MKKNIIILVSVILVAIAGRFIFSGYGQMMRGKMMAKGAPQALLWVKSAKSALSKKSKHPEE